MINLRHRLSPRFGFTKRCDGKVNCLFISLALCSLASVAIAQEPYKLDAEQRNYLQDNNQGYQSYPAPQYIPTQPTHPHYQGRLVQPHANPVSTPPPRMISGGVEKSVSLPPAFQGVWNVQGQRMKVEAMPEFQQGAEQAFTLNNEQVWTIKPGANGGYALGSNTGIETAIVVDKVEGNTAFIRYQHPVGKTMAQEAVVMSLVAGGAQFNGLERVSIVKEGLATPRAKVTYQLVGRRQN